MPRLLRTPSYRLHKPTGQAVVTLNGQDVYLGLHGTPRSKAEYDRIITEWIANGRRLARPDDPVDLTVNEVMFLYRKYAEQHYSRDGVRSPGLHNIRDSLRHLKQPYGHTSAAEFGPKALKAVRQAMIDRGLARSTINGRIQLIKRMFRWAASEELIPS